MRKPTTAIAAASLVCLMGAAIAQEDDAPAAPSFNPAETYSCSYNDGMGPAELDALVEDWSAWMDERGANNYFASTLVPFYHGADTFDFAWLGAWMSGEEMGKSTDDWLMNGGEFAGRFAELASCDTHSGWAVTQIKAPPEGESPDNFLLQFSDCKVVEGQTMSDAWGGIASFAEYQNEQGYRNGIWLMFAAYGGGDAEFDFKIVSSSKDFSELGREWDLYANGGGYQAHVEAIGGFLECDESRVYLATVRRQIPEE